MNDQQSDTDLAGDSMTERAAARPHRGIARRLGIGILGMATLIVATIALAVFGLRDLSDTIRTVNRTTLPAVETAGEITRVVRSIDSQVRDLPNLRTAFATDAAWFRLRQSIDALGEKIDTIDRSRIVESEFADMERSVDTVRRLIARLSTLIKQRTQLELRHRRDVEEITDLRRSIEDSWSSAADRQAIARVAESLRDWTGVILSALSTPRPDRVIVLQEQYDTVRDQLFQHLAESDAAVLGAFPGVLERINALRPVFNDRLEYLETDYRTKSTLRRLVVMDRLISRVEEIADDLAADARAQASGLEDTITELTLTMMIVAVFGAALAATLLIFAKRRIVDRIVGLRDTMLSHVAGEPRPVDTGGADEITDMSHSFVHFVDEVKRRESRLEDRRRELHAAATALAAKETQLRTALDTMSDGLFMLDTDNRFELFNQNYLAFADDAGIPRPMVDAGRPIYEALLAAAKNGLYGDGDAEELARARLSVFLTPGSASREVTTPSGRAFELRKASRDEGGSVTVLTDITERKSAEDRLHKALEQISDSINYASFIQRALLPPKRYLAEDLADHFVLWQPRDVVGGDLYWYRRCHGGFVLVLGDCTGHGVPGAFMTMIATGTLDRALRDNPDGDPAHLLANMNRGVKISLRQDEAEGESDDGLELGICKIESDARRLVFAGARFELLHVTDAGIETIKGDRSAIGYRSVPLDQTFTNREITYKAGDRFYMISDGLIDQVGGEKGRSFGKKRFGALVAEIAGLPMEEQKQKILDAFTAYQGEQVRRDDVSVMGFTP